MSKQKHSHVSDMAHGSYTSYIVGFVTSVALTVFAFMVVQRPGNLSRTSLLTLILSLASVQLLVQLIFFLHLGRESKPRWNLMLFLFMGLMLGIIVIGSLWIMDNLDYHGMADPAATDAQIIKDEGIH